MYPIKVLIVEDELIIAEDLKEILRELGYHVIGMACDSNEAKDLLAAEVPDIALLDIQLRYGDNGIDLAQHIRRNYDLPIIFITSYSDKDTVNRAKEVKPDGYLVKPFEKGDIFSSIEIALSNFFSGNRNLAVDKDESSYFFKEFLFVKKKYQFEKVNINDIQWIKSEGNYLEMICNNEKKYLIRSSFRELFRNIENAYFLQVHKSYAVNFKFVDTVRPNEIVIGKSRIPVGKAYQENIRNHMRIML
jgi:two-component system response regulator LytT